MKLRIEVERLVWGADHRIPQTRVETAMNPAFEALVDTMGALPSRERFDVPTASRGKYCCRACKRYHREPERTWKSYRASQYKVR